MALGRTAPLREAVQAALPSRPFTLRFWDGSSLAATEAGAPTFTFRSPEALAHVLRAPGELGLGRAYVAGLLDVDDLDAALRIVDTYEPPPLPLAARLQLGLGVLRACGLVVPPRAPEAELRLRGERHSLSRDRRAVRHHYDVGNDFFALFLDASMTYSCAVLLARRAHARGSPGGQARAGLLKAGAGGGRAGARRRLRVGQLRAARGAPPRRERRSA